jgi:hypothetical protein
MKTGSERLHTVLKNKPLRWLGTGAVILGFGAVVSMREASGAHNDAQVAANTGQINPNPNVASDISASSATANDNENMVKTLEYGAGGLALATVIGAIGVAAVGKREHDLPLP